MTLSKGERDLVMEVMRSTLDTHGLSSKDLERKLAYYRRQLRLTRKAMKIRESDLDSLRSACNLLLHRISTATSALPRKKDE